MAIPGQLHLEYGHTKYYWVRAGGGKKYGFKAEKQEASLVLYGLDGLGVFRGRLVRLCCIG